jgi:hypothetical protein
MAGMDLTDDSVVLAIGGSGDQAFAMLDVAKGVIAVDSTPVQVRYIEQRRKQLSKGDFKNFMNPEGGISDGFYKGDHSNEWHYDLLRRRDSFFTPERLERIRAKANNIEVLNADITDVRAKYSRIYATNATSDNGVTSDYGFVYHLVETLQKNGILYFATEKKRVPNHAIVDERLTRAARDLEDRKYWTPTVIRRLTQSK